MCHAAWLMLHDSCSMTHTSETKPEMEVSAYESVLIVNVCYVALLCGNMQFILDWQLCRIAQLWNEIISNQNLWTVCTSYVLADKYRKWNQTRNQSVKDGINRVKIGFRFRSELTCPVSDLVPVSGLTCFLFRISQQLF